MQITGIPALAPRRKRPDVNALIAKLDAPKGAHATAPVPAAQMPKPGS